MQKLKSSSNNNIDLKIRCAKMMLYLKTNSLAFHIFKIKQNWLGRNDETWKMNSKIEASHIYQLNLSIKQEK